MLRFEHTFFLWGLVLIPLLLILFYRNAAWKRNALRMLGDPEVVRKNIPEFSGSKSSVKFSLWIVAYALVIIALANPQIGTKLEEVKRKGADFMILLDVSNSMLAQDLAPNRLENAKMALSQLLDNLHDDRVGIIVFAGQAYVQLPMTTDYSAAKIFLNSINPGMVPTQGTAIGAAINLGLKSMDFKNGMAKSMIVMTDGENHEDDAVQAAATARSQGVSINVIGLGSEQGAPIPSFRNGLQQGFHTDSVGKTVISKMNEAMCRQIAVAGGGISVRAANSSIAVKAVMDQIGKMQRKEYGSKTFKDFEDRFQLFLIGGLILLVLEFFIYNRKNRRLSRLKLFEVK